MKPKIIYLLFFLVLNFSCANTESSNTKPLNLAKNKVSFENLDKKTPPKLKYTSGIRSIFHDSRGNYWLGSHNEGVCLFDGKTFRYFTMKNGLSDNQIRTIQEDKTGGIWFGTGNGVSSYKDGKITNHTQKGFLLLDGVTDGTWSISENDLWFNAGDKAGVYRFNGYQLNYLAYPNKENTAPFHPNSVTGFSKGKSKIWIATYETLFSYDGKSFETIDDKSLGHSKEKEYLHIRSIFEDSKGRVWIGNNGLGVLLKNDDTTINFSEKKGLLDINNLKGGGSSPAGTLEHVFKITEDKEGNIWFGDRDTNVWKYDGKSMTNYIIDEAFPRQHIWEIYENNDGELLIGTGTGGVYQFNGKSFDRKFE